jgi:hypothetical protein
VTARRSTPARKPVSRGAHRAPASGAKPGPVIPDGPVRLTAPRGTRAVVHDRNVVERLIRRGYTFTEEGGAS